MIETLRPADPGTIQAVAKLYPRGVRRVEVDGERLEGSERFRFALDSLTVTTVRNPGSVAPVLGSAAQPEFMGGGHA